MKKFTVIDLFCGAGGFSEGFRQQGFEVVQGIDFWKPAVDTFNYNFGLECSAQDILELSNSIDDIEGLLDTDIIIGSPPCTSFSSSNKSGLADKTDGIRLTEAFFKIIVVKKYKSKSRLKAWFMENVASVQKYIKDRYTFNDLNLANWAKKQGISPNKVALDIAENYRLLNSADYGVAQIRKRLFLGEIVKTGLFPEIDSSKKTNQPISLKQIFKNFPSPYGKNAEIQDPNFPKLKVASGNLTDHFYDTGIYRCAWEEARYAKENHPYMGRMSFPENTHNPSRTVTATKLANSREALIYKCELGRKGNGQYRTPTIRELAVLMSFPITYQFLESENAKWRLVGNAVCPLVSAAIAKATLKSLGKQTRSTSFISKAVDVQKVNNLNSPTRKKFDNHDRPIRKKGSRLRRHIFKNGNMTVALSNYSLKENKSSDGKWRTTVTYGTGSGYKLQELRDREQGEIEKFIKKNFEDGPTFVENIQNGFSEKIIGGKELQEIYEHNELNHKSHPNKLLEEVEGLVNKHADAGEVNVESIFLKGMMPKNQLYTSYAISQISKLANIKV